MNVGLLRIMEESTVGWRWIAKSLTIEQENRTAFLAFSPHRPKSGSDQIITPLRVNSLEDAIHEFLCNVLDMV